MKTLYILQGAPGVGKSTAINELKLEDYVVSPDRFRETFPLVETQVNGKTIKVIDQGKSKQAWELTRLSIEFRVAESEPIIVLDAVNARYRSFKDIVKLAKLYKYNVVLVNVQGNITLEELYDRNKKRPEHKYVNEEIIERFWNNVNAYQKVNEIDEHITKNELYERLTKGE